MNQKHQSWQPLDPAAGSVPGEIESALGDGDSLFACVVILVDSELDRDWGAQASLAVARKWAASGHHVILADACLDRPVLHKAAGIENGEGVSDVVLYGASVPRTAQPVGDGLLLASAGTPAVQVADILSHVKWDMVIRGCREARVTLVFHVSTDTPGVEAMTRRAEGVLVLAQASTDVDSILGSEAGPLIAVLGPENGDAPFSALEGEEADAPTVVMEEEKGDAPTAVIEQENGDVLSAMIEDEEVDVGSVEGLPSPPEEDGEDVLSHEESPAPSEDEAPLAFSLEDFPDPDPSPDSDDEEGTSEAFSMTGLEGGQYEGDDSPEVGTGDLESGSDMEVASSTDDAAEAEEGAEAEDDGQDEAEGEVPLSQADDMEMGAALNIDDEAVAAAASTSLDMEGFETGAGFNLEDVPDSIEDPSDQTSVVVEPTALVDDGEERAVDVEPAAGAASFTDLDTEDSQGRVDGEALPTGERREAEEEEAKEKREEEGEEKGEEKGEARRKYRGLARLERRRKRAALLRQFLIGVVTILIVGGGGAVAAYFGWVTIPGFTPAERVGSYAPAPVELAGPLPETAVMSHVLWIDSSRGIESALSTANALRGRLPNLLFFVVPLELDGTRQFAVYVGPAYSAVEANALKDPVAVALDRLDPNDWSVRAAPYAFFFGEYDTAADAQGRVQTLAGVSVPAYWLQVAYPDGTTGMRVYGGAFSDEFQASEMGQMVSDADIGEMVLTLRRGTLPE